MPYINIGEIIYPVGYIYQSSEDVSPAELFGGTWEKIEDAMFWLPGTEYGTEGGESEHLLSTDEMPKHKHKLSIPTYDGNAPNYGIGQAATFAYSLYSKYWCDGTWNRGNELGGSQWTGVGYNGESVAHNNMPPYRTCHYWRRIS